MSDLRALHLVGAIGKARVETFDGREHLVVPVVQLIGDNVIHAVNAPAAEFVPAGILSAQGWNGRPLVLGHPTEGGVQISANDPKVIERQGFGFIAAAKLNGKRLGSEAWCDVAKLERLGQVKMLEDLRAGKPVEVSVGAFVQTRDKAGIAANGKRYAAEWATIAPDHLAFLPGSTGACSVEMGCGANRAAMRVMEASDQLEDAFMEQSIIDPVTLKCLRDIPQSERDEMDESDFAGPDQSFPIKAQADVDAAKRLIGKAANPAAVKAKIIAIAKRKGLTIPDAWKSGPKAAMAKIFAAIKALAEGDGAGGIDMGEPDLDPTGEEESELVCYQTMKTLLDTTAAHLQETCALVDDLISAEEDDPTETAADEDAEETVECAKLDAIRMLAYTMISSLNNVCSLTRSQQDPIPMTGYEHRAAIGKAISAKNMKTIQAAHDASHDMHNHTVALGAQCNGMKLLEAAAGDPLTLRAACGCKETDMTSTERAAALKEIAALKDANFTQEEIRGLSLLSDKGVTGLKTLAAKSPADAIIQAKSNADAALAAHAHGLNAKDQADAAAKKAKEDAAAENDNDNADDDPGEKDGTKKMKAAAAAAKAAGFETVEAHEEAKWLDAHPAVKATVVRAAQAEAARKEELVETLKACGALSEEQLKAKTLAALEELAAFAKIPVPDYSGGGVRMPRAAEGAEDVFLNPPDPYKLALEARKKQAVN